LKNGYFQGNITTIPSGQRRWVIIHT